MRGEPPPPVFLHCGWRTRGTWIWSRFRAMPGVAAFYEPLSDTLASLRPASVARHHPGAWQSGHRYLQAPYFAEFAPLLQPGRRGVDCYDRAFATREFFAAPDAAMPALEAYLRRLLRSAQDRGEQPVLKFCRSIGRAGWMQRHFPEAVHIAVVRNPLTQFESARQQLLLHDNAYFLALPLLLLAAHRDLPAVRSCTRRLDVALPEAIDWLAPRAAMVLAESLVRRADPLQWYRMFLAFWVLCAAAVPASIGQLIDSDRLAGPDCYREECAETLRRLTGRAVHLDQVEHAGPLFGGARYWPQCRDILAAHHTAEVCLAELRGSAPDDPSGHAWACQMLGEASLLALKSDELRSGIPTWLAAPVTQDATLLAATRRAIGAEERLAALLASRSWRWTAPLRWLHRRLAGALAERTALAASPRIRLALRRPMLADSPPRIVPPVHHGAPAP